MSKKKERDSTMKRLSMVVIALPALLGCAKELHAAESETFTGTAARSGTYKRPLLNVDCKRYEVKASDKADASVAELLKKFSGGDTGRYVVKGTRGTVNGGDDSIAPADKPLPSAGGAAPGTSAVPGIEPTAPAQATPAVTSSVVTVGSDRYLVYNYDDLATRDYTVVIPEGLKTVRGLLVHGCYAGGDSRQDWTICEYYRQFMHLHDFAYVGCTGTVGSPNSAPPPPAEDTARARHHGIFLGFQDSMKVFATATRHPELVNAPYVGVGFSAGGGFALNLMAFAPEKTIASVSYCSPYNFKRRVTPPVSDALLSVPSISITGEEEGFNAPLAPNVDPSTGPARIDEVFVPYRPKGGEYAWLERQGLGHAYDANRQDVLGMPLLHAAVRARYPKDGDVTKGTIRLLSIDPATGWIADNTTWKSGLTKIYPAKEFKGDLGHSSWLQNEDLAFIYRAYSTYDKPLTITSPGDCWPTMPALDPGASVPIIVDATRFPGWKTIAFYDGAKKKETDWLAGDFAGKHFVQRISLDLAGRTRIEVARDWVKKLTTAIREIDDRHMVTVGVIPWAHVFKGAKPLFYSPEVTGPLDFVSVHFYPKKGDVESSLAALAVYDVGKPLVIEEVFPLRSSIEEVGTFIDGSRKFTDGWISFYWGATIEENEQKGDPKGALLAQWLRYFRSQSPYTPKD